MPDDVIIPNSYQRRQKPRRQKAQKLASSLFPEAKRPSSGISFLSTLPPAAAPSQQAPGHTGENVFRLSQSRWGAGIAHVATAAAMPFLPHFEDHEQSPESHALIIRNVVYMQVGALKTGPRQLGRFLTLIKSKLLTYLHPQLMNPGQCSSSLCQTWLPRDRKAHIPE